MGKWSTLIEQQKQGVMQQPTQTPSQPSTQPTEGKWSTMIQQQNAVPAIPGFEGGGRSAGGTTGRWSPDDWITVLKEAALNAPKSAYHYGKGIYEALRHPMETAKGIGKLGIGLGQSFVGKDTENARLYMAVENAMKERYGTIDGFKNAVAEDPVGILADVAAILIPASKVAGVPQVTKFATALEPTNIAIRAAKLPFKLIPEKVPVNLYKSAVKFGTTLTDKQRTAVTKTALNWKHQIMPTEKGLRKLRGLIDEYNTKINALVDQAAVSGKTIQVDRLYQGLDKVTDQFKLMSDEPLAWDAAFVRLKKQWKATLDLGETRTPQQVQKIKQGIYRDLAGYYEKFKASPAKVELRKTVARNCRRTLEEIIPEIKQLNKREGALIELWDALESKANRITNRDLIGIGLPLKMGTGAGVGYMFAGETGGSVGTAVGFALGVFDTPQVKAKIALVAETLRSKKIPIRPTPAAIRLGLFESEKIEEDYLSQR